MERNRVRVSSSSWSNARLTKESYSNVRLRRYGDLCITHKKHSGVFLRLLKPWGAGRGMNFQPLSSSCGNEFLPSGRFSTRGGFGGEAARRAGQKDRR